MLMKCIALFHFGDEPLFEVVECHTTSPGVVFLERAHAPLLTKDETGLRIIWPTPPPLLSLG